MLTHAHVQTTGLDYCEVVFALCEVLSLVYTKFLDGACAQPAVLEGLLKTDAKVKVGAAAHGAAAVSHHSRTLHTGASVTLIATPARLRHWHYRGCISPQAER